MKVACVLLPDFEVAVELSRHPELAGRPVVVGGLPHDRKPVRSHSREAAAFGIAVGMSLRQASGLCPEAVFLHLDEQLYQTVFARVLETLDAFSPKVETEERRGDGGTRGHGDPTPSTKNSSLITHHSSLVTYLDASGLELLFGPDEELGERISTSVELRTGLRPQVGIGGSKFVAWAAAMLAAVGSTTVVRSGEERSFLAPLPVEWLPSSQEMQRRLRLFGLRTVGQLAGLPAGALGEQFGPEGVAAARLARGIDERPVVARDVPTVLREEVEIDRPADGGSLLIEEARQLARRLEARMRARYLACREVALDLVFDDGFAIHLSTTLHEPTDREADLQLAAERLLGRAWARLPSPASLLPAGAGFKPAPTPEIGILVSLLRLSLSGFGGHQGEQLELFESRAAGLKRVRRAIQQAEGLFGEGAIGSLAEVADQKPEAGWIKVIAEVEGQPRALFLGGRREKVREVPNRWRVQGEWWRRERVREYYRVITESGRLCLIFQDLLGGGWFLERVYD
jgi:DNA polymerase IV